MNQPKPTRQMMELIQKKLVEKKSAIRLIHVNPVLNSDHRGYTVYIEGTDESNEPMNETILISFDELEKQI